MPPAIPIATYRLQLSADFNFDAAASVAPYLRALGDYGTGKTRFIQTVGVLCYRPMLVS